MTRPGSDPAADSPVVAIPKASGSPPRRSSPSHRRDQSTTTTAATTLLNSDDGENFAQLIGSLWEHAPFPRLPADAPLELHQYVHDVENPHRVYAIHRATRRYCCQALVEKFVIQLRHGCDTKTCSTPSCFSYRKLAAGKAPIRRYNMSSARTLAVYLASTDNPDDLLCPNLRIPKTPPAAVQSLSFSPRYPDQWRQSRSHKRPPAPVDGQAPHPNGPKDGHASPPQPRGQPSAYADRRPSPPLRLRGSYSSHSRRERGELQPNGGVSGRNEPGFKITDRPVAKDHRSFVANVFGTVAFKMIEWLSPSGIEYMTKKAGEAMAEASSFAPAATELHVPSKADQVPAPAPAPVRSEPREDMSRDNVSTVPHSASTAASADRGDGSDKGVEKHHPKTGPSRRNSNATVRTPSGSKVRRKVSLEPFPPPIDDANLVSKPNPISAKMNSLPPEMPRPLPSRQAPSIQGSGEQTAETPTGGVQQQPEPQPEPPAEDTDDKASPQSTLVDEAHTEKPPPEGATPRAAEMPEQRKTQASQALRNSRPTPEYRAVLPQSLSRLSVDVIEFICRVLEADASGEFPLFDASFVPEVLPCLQDPPRTLLRRALSRRPYPASLRKEWKLFIEQGIFAVLSDPHALVQSFAADGSLLDSAMVWYCMMRLTRATPTLVLDSLWLASASLFAPPKCLQAPRPSTSHRDSPNQPLSNEEAAHLMSICLHALVAAVPLVGDANHMRAISAVRSSGLTFPLNDKTSRPSRAVYMQYHDVFSNELALRLAKRLFASLEARRCYAELVDHDDDVPETAEDLDLLQPLFTQLEDSDPSAWLMFPSVELPVYETRVPAGLLDWAKSVMMDEWDGHPEFASDGPFGGALSLMTALYRKRKPLMIGESLFRAEYFADRLDATTMPIAWLAFTPTRQRQHLLDYPFIFSPSSLVTFFRVINLSRMLEHHHEAKTLISRCMALDESNTMLTPRYQEAVADFVRTASARHFVLNIRRHNLLGDTFDQLWRRELRELVRPLKVFLGQHEGEEGADLGGVQQEFFRLVMAQCLDPSYGAFTLDDRTRMSWFVPGSVVDLWKFELIGLLVSLAIYNGLTLPVTFPRALYRKLLRRPVREIHHVEDGWPDLAAGLNILLEWDESQGTVEDVFSRTYEFSVEAFGRHVSRDMRSRNFEGWPTASSTMLGEGGCPPAWAENPHDAPMVTSANRDAYVTDYIEWLTDVSVAPQYQAFERGFNACLYAKSLSILTPSLLQTIVEGVQEIDVAELHRHAQHVGWAEGDRSPDFFWDVVGRYDDAMKRKLLAFVTASERVPVGGMSGILFTLQKNGAKPETGLDRLPAAYTCFGVLLLPEYESREVLEERLATALDNGRGFGFA